MKNDPAVQDRPVTAIQEPELQSHKRVCSQHVLFGSPHARKLLIYGPQAAKDFDDMTDTLSRGVRAYPVVTHTHYI